MINIDLNHRSNIEKRNEIFLKEEFNLSLEQWFEKFRELGPPSNKFKDQWSLQNPTRSWCGGVTSGLRLSGRIPKGYIPCRNKVDPHYYFINPKTNEIIDLTVYQMDGEYGYDYLNYSQQFMNVLSKTIKLFLGKFNLDIDKNQFAINTVKKVDYIKSV